MQILIDPPDQMADSDSGQLKRLGRCLCVYESKGRPACNNVLRTNNEDRGVVV